MMIIKKMVYLIFMMALSVNYCNGGPRGLPGPNHDDATAPDDAGPRAVALRALAIGAAVIGGILAIGIIIVCCRCRSSRSPDL
jgi:hypothetical protein